MVSYRNLIELALNARQFAYAPYSHFWVGSALLTSENEVYTGCNIEFSSYSPTVCAERVALLKAVSSGKNKIVAMAIAGGFETENPNSLKSLISPCGVCRQSLSEFCEDSFVIIAARNVNDSKLYTLGELLPNRFVLEK